MPDVGTSARGRRARAARRRAEKAEIRRLERAGMVEDTDEALTGGSDQPTTANSDRVPSGDREANHVAGAIDHDGTGRVDGIQADGAVSTGLVAGIREDRTRRSGFSRQDVVLAANVDIAVIVAAVAQPAFHPKLVDRFLVICQYGGIRPILCLNKCDLVQAPPDVTVYEQIGLPVVYSSAEVGTGLEELRSLLRGSIAVFTGHSGVGKSSLVNALLGDARQVVGAVRNVDGRGRHTTT